MTFSRPESQRQQKSCQCCMWNIRVFRCRLRFSRLLNTLGHWLQPKESGNLSPEIEAEFSCDWLTNGGASSGAAGARAVDIIVLWRVDCAVWPTKCCEGFDWLSDNPSQYVIWPETTEEVKWNMAKEESVRGS
jgi:hypothetical protein